MPTVCWALWPRGQHEPKTNLNPQFRGATNLSLPLLFFLLALLLFNVCFADLLYLLSVTPMRRKFQKIGIFSHFPVFSASRTVSTCHMIGTQFTCVVCVNKLKM